MKKNKTPLLLRAVQWFYPRLEKALPALAHRFFVTVFFTPLNYPVPEKEKAVRKQARQETLLVNQKQIRVYSWGRGPVILLVHGWAGRGSQFRKFIPELVKSGYRAVAFDGPAHGESSGTSTSIQEFETVLQQLYRHAGVPEAIIAHSFGGGAVLYAAMNGLHVKKLINIASPTVGDEIINTYLRTINGSPATADFFKEYFRRKAGRPFEEFTALHFIKHLKQDLDLLLVHDENDEEVSISHAHELITLYPKAALVTTKGLGHTRILKDDKVISRCISFIKGEPPVAEGR